MNPAKAKTGLGTEIPKPDLPILVLAGHADSQRMAGSGTPGRAVGMGGARPMQPGITDELFWNLLTAKAVVAEGQRQGLKMRFYDPGVRTIRDSDDPRTNWSVGASTSPRAVTPLKSTTTPTHPMASGPASSRRCSTASR